MRPGRPSTSAGFLALALLLLAGASTQTLRDEGADGSPDEIEVQAGVPPLQERGSGDASAPDPTTPVDLGIRQNAAGAASATSEGTVQAAPAETEAPRAGGATDTDPASASNPRGATAPVTRSADATRADVDEPDTRRRRYRRRYRNRYPGPIPTPEDWQPPEGPVKIALQAGHWRAHEAPIELSGLRDNGTRWEGVAEWEANLSVARRTADLLEASGYEVEILPAVVPPGYRAHLFVSIHADGSADSRASGYRVASPRRDATGRASTIASLLEGSYGEATGLRHITTSTRRMRNYYAFNFRRYEHALHPMTIAVILETGFLTSARDRSIILDDPDRAARGIVDAIRAFPVTALPSVADEDDPEDALDGTTGTDRPNPSAPTAAPPAGAPGPGGA